MVLGCFPLLAHAMFSSGYVYDRCELSSIPIHHNLFLYPCGLFNLLAF